jgi:hypothetical protein
MGETRRLEATLAALRTTGRRPLALDEVVAIGRPAIYSRYGEALLFMNGTIFDVREPFAPSELSLGVPLNDPAVVRHAVGIEFGWRHALDCSCDLCQPQGLVD